MPEAETRFARVLFGLGIGGGVVIEGIMPGAAVLDHCEVHIDSFVFAF